MMDKIIIDNLRVFCNHGVYEEEKQNGQNFYVSAILYLDTYPAGVTDELDKSVNYAELCHSITQFMKNNRYNLIEAVAHRLSEHIFAYSGFIRGIDLKISKPEAPIGLPFKNISVEINRRWRKTYVAVGSNMGDSYSIIDEAVKKMSANPAIRLMKKSSLIVTKPYGGVEQPDFINGVLELETYLEPEKLLDYLNSLEKEAGRTRDIHWGPRTLDLDIILYDNEIINSEKLIVPHIDMESRSFVLDPLCEIAPYAYNPRLGKNASQLQKELDSKA